MNSLNPSPTLATRLCAVALLLAGSVLAEVHYVDVNNTNATPPFTNWATAATNIQDAVDAAIAGDEIVVTNGVYKAGARDVYGMSNRVAVTKAVTVRSVNGPAVTSIVGLRTSGGTAVRCAYLTNAALLAGFTLTNGATQISGDLYTNQSGGGIWCESWSAIVSNCVLTGNEAARFGIGGSGGGAISGTLINCILSNNIAVYGGGAASSRLNYCTLRGNVGPFSGGGAEFCTLNNCTLVGNTSRHGGGADSSELNNCTVVGNSALDAGGANYCSLNNCIVAFNSYAGDPPNHSWTADPLFVDTNGWANLRLQSNSPCINAGNNAYAPAGPDLDGNPRIAGGTVDIGAYEFQNPASIISYAWLQQFGLPISPLTDTADPDGDGVDNYHEWLAGTIPTNSLSSPARLTILGSGSNLILSWSTNAVGFTLQSTTNLSSLASWSTNSLAPFVSNSLNTVTNPISGAQQFYRLRQ